VKNVLLLRQSVLRSVVEPPPYVPAPSGDIRLVPAEHVTAAVALSLGHMSLRDICAATRVCRAWKAAIDRSPFWSSLVWWNDTALVLAVGHGEQLPPKLRGELGRWMLVAEKCAKLTLRQQALAVLSASNACNVCGMALQNRHWSKAEKTGAVVREVPALSHLRAVCTDCANEFVVPQQAARSAFPAVTRSDYVNLYSFKMDHRKCLLLSDLRECQRRRNAELLEQEAARKNTTARALWEQRHVPRRERGADPVRAFFEEDDDDEALAQEIEQQQQKQRAEMEKRVQWVPARLVYEQPGEEWAPDSLETVARRNLQLLQQLGLARVLRSEEDRVGFVETLEEPIPADDLPPVAPIVPSARNVKTRRAVDDEDDYEDEKSSKSLAEDESALFICFPPCFPFVYFGSQATAQSLLLRLLLLESEVARRQRAGTLISMKRMKMTMDTDDQRPRRKRRMLKWKRAKQLHWRAKLQPQRKRRLLKRPRSASLPGRSIRIVRWWKTKI
jgi:hypothetical protein